MDDAYAPRAHRYPQKVIHVMLLRSLPARTFAYSFSLQSESIDFHSRRFKYYPSWLTLLNLFHSAPLQNGSVCSGLPHTASKICMEM